jgi:hypothetical protein
LSYSDIQWFVAKQMCVLIAAFAATVMPPNCDFQATREMHRAPEADR